eukprot:5409219-Alexandrium_andersonii.AAC.1
MLRFTHGGLQIEADCSTDGPCVDCGLHFGPLKDARLSGSKRSLCLCLGLGRLDSSTRTAALSAALHSFQRF